MPDGCCATPSMWGFTLSHCGRVVSNRFGCGVDRRQVVFEFAGILGCNRRTWTRHAPCLVQVGDARHARLSGHRVQSQCRPVGSCSPCNAGSWRSHAVIGVDLCSRQAHRGSRASVPIGIRLPRTRSAQLLADSSAAQSHLRPITTALSGPIRRRKEAIAGSERAVVEVLLIANAKFNCPIERPINWTWTSLAGSWAAELSDRHGQLQGSQGRYLLRGPFR